MNYLIEPKNPNDPMKYFQEISYIPRGSGHEKAISDYIMEFAKKHGLWCKQDDENNVYVKKDGLGTGKDKPAVLLQGHIDMVWEKNNDTEFDFETQPLDLYIEDGWLKARGTTLGADNGVAVAYMMSVLADNFENCPPIECLFTTGEETGMFGAFAADTSVFSATSMINMDCGPEGIFTVSCSGGRRTNVTIDVSRENISNPVIQIVISGLKGGHSGADIHLERGNANRLMSRLLYEIMRNQSVNILNINGGDKDNAIPRECVCDISIEDIDKAEKTIEDMRNIFSEELASSDPEIKIEVQKISEKCEMPVISENDTRKIVELIRLFPSGPVHRNIKLDDLVVSSNNLAVVNSHENSVAVNMSTRSSVLSLKEDITTQIELICKAYGVEYAHSSEYPGWAYEEKSIIRDLCKDVYEELYEKSPQIVAIHAGLECGLLKEKMPNLDIVAIGPDMEDIHTPEEKLDIESFNRMYEYIVKVLEKMSV